MTDFSIMWGAPGLLHVLQHTDPLPTTALDVGAGAGEHARLMRHFGIDVTTLDRHSPADIATSLTETDFGGRRFDLVWASHVLEHQRNPGEFLDRLIDLCVPGGIVVVAVPNHTRHALIPGHCNAFSAGTLLYQMVLAGIDCHDASVLADKEIIVIARNDHALHSERRAEAAYQFDSVAKFLPDFLHPSRVLPAQLLFNWKRVSKQWFEDRGASVKTPLWEDC